jgi:histidinol-phosphatase (PHP family)
MTNYHTHTYRCRHADGDVADYVAAALDAGLTELGFSDHLPFPDGLWPETRMDLTEADAYRSAIAAATPAAAAAGLRLSAGFECEWRRDQADFLRALRDRFSLDFLVGGVHWIPSGGDWLPCTHITGADELAVFTDLTVETIASGLFDFLAHPDLFCARWPRWDAEAVACAKAIFSAAAAADLPLEINGYGFRKPWIASADGHRPQYPFAPFWELAAGSGVRIIVNSDAHRPQDVAASLGDGRALAERYGLPIIERIGNACYNGINQRQL